MSEICCAVPVESHSEVLQQALRWMELGRDVILVTVTRTWGSAPRPIGSMAALCSDGRLVGSVSGGCIEDELVEEFMRGAVEIEHPTVREYGVEANQARRFGLPCGGTIQLVVEPLAGRSQLTELVRMMQGHCLVKRTITLADGKSMLTPVDTDTGVQLRATTFQICLGRSHRLLLIGAGDLSQFIARNAVSLDYHVTVCDPRVEYTDTWTLNDVALSSEMPDDVVLEMKLDARSAVIALTHDPKLDDLALMEALKTPAFYVAAIGSRRSHAARVERLKMFDVSDAEVAKLRGPGGLHIGALTPAFCTGTTFVVMGSLDAFLTMSPIPTCKSRLFQ